MIVIVDAGDQAVLRLDVAVEGASAVDRGQAGEELAQEPDGAGPGDGAAQDDLAEALSTGQRISRRSPPTSRGASPSRRSRRRAAPPTPRSSGGSGRCGRCWSRRPANRPGSSRRRPSRSPARGCSTSRPRVKARRRRWGSRRSRDGGSGLRRSGRTGARRERAQPSTGGARHLSGFKDTMPTTARAPALRPARSPDRASLPFTATPSSRGRRTPGAPP